MATTTNYGWTTPDDTALVKDGASAIRSLGTSVDTTTKNLNPSTTLGDIEYRSSTANTNTRLGIGTSGQCLTVNAGVPSWQPSATSVLTTVGDMLYEGSGPALARLGIGSTGQVLTVAGGVPTWAAAGGGGLTWTLLNSGGTNLTGAATITVSGITAKNNLMILITDASSASAGANIWIRLNTDSGSNYYYAGPTLQWESTYVAGDVGASSNYYPGSTGFYFGRMTGNANSSVNGYCRLEGTNSGDLVSAFWAGGGTVGGSGQNGHHSKMMGGFYDSSATITSISVHSDFGNLDGGKVYVYGA